MELFLKMTMQFYDFQKISAIATLASYVMYISCVHIATLVAT